MSIPLDNLYHWVESLLPVPAILYVFQPHGSKKISDCIWFSDHNRATAYRFPGIIAHDQEPLDWEFYNLPDQYLDVEWNKRDPVEKNDLEISRVEYYSKFNLKCVVFAQSSHLYDRVILIHSEKNSKDLEQYQQNGFLCVHYWAHAVIARDWYRFAKHDKRLNTNAQLTHKFLIYCRDWSHRREYRLKFLEMLVTNELDKDSLTSVMHTNSDNVHYSNYEFLNPQFKLSNPETISQIKNNNFSSTASADYDYQDFINTQVNVVLETVFDDSRIHLTEKTLRPIACGHPFLLAAGPNSLEYIRSYGFKTFAPWIDESYDLETDSFKRLEKIINSMKQIQKLQGIKLENFSRAVKEIADYNKEHFFSEKFFTILEEELKNNLVESSKLVRQTQGKYYMEALKIAKRQGLHHLQPMRKEKLQLIRQLRQSSQFGRSSPRVDPSV
jgi:hypothetical protein